MNRYILFLVLLALTASCYQKAPEPSFNMENVLSKDSMIVLLTELQLVDGAVNMNARKGKPLIEYARAYTKQVLDQHGIQRDVFEESIRYYSFHIEEMDAIYEQVIINLGKIESEVEQAAQAEKEAEKEAEKAKEEEKEQEDQRE